MKQGLLLILFITLFTLFQFNQAYPFGSAELKEECKTALALAEEQGFTTSRVDGNDITVFVLSEFWFDMDARQKTGLMVCYQAVYRAHHVYAFRLGGRGYPEDILGVWDAWEYKLPLIIQ
jgi:hypothetical protein